MKELLKIVHFDYLTAKPLTLSKYITAAVIAYVLSVVISPIAAGYLIFIGMFMINALSGVGEKSEFNKLYGILPVKRKNITRARFLYIFLVMFISELTELLMAASSFAIKFYRFLPDKSTLAVSIGRKSIEEGKLSAYAFLILGFAAFCIMFSYMEMMSSFFGRENEFKIIIVTLGVLTVLILIVNAIINSMDNVVIKIPSLPKTATGRIIAVLVVNIAVFCINVLFGELTANKVSKREL